MQISEVTVIALMVMVLINTLLVTGIAVLLYMVNRKAEQALNKAGPLVERVSHTLGRLEETTSQVQTKVDRVLDRTSHLVDQVTDRVDASTAVVEKVVAEPLIGAASLLAGINQGFRTYNERKEDSAAEKPGITKG